MSLSDTERAQLGFPIDFKFKPGLYRHWKGGLYRALFLAQDSTNRYPGKAGSSEEPMVVYMSLDDPGNLCVRTLAQWNEVVDRMKPVYGDAKVLRFKWVGP